MKAKPRFKKVLLKLSGEALQGGKQFGIDNSMVTRLAGEIAEAVSLGVRLGLVVGGGNFVRGAQVAREGGNRVAGDQMGMLATVMNSIALNEALVSTGVEARLFSAVPMPTFCETFSQQRAIKAFEAGRVTIFAGGTGNPFFTTDSGAALRAGGRADAETLAKLAAGSRFDVLDIAGGIAWGQAVEPSGDGSLVGYVALDQLEDAA